MGLFGSSDYKPKSDKALESPEMSNEIGWVRGEFEAFQMNPDFNYDKRGNEHTEYPQVSPITPSEHAPLDQMTRRMIETLWKRAEPSAGAQRGALKIGAGKRGESEVPQTRAYSPHVNPSNLHGTAFADDWGFMDQIPRTDAYTFRGDSRGPAQLLSQAGGFSPPSSRTDRFYLEGPITKYFTEYMKRRYNVDVTPAQFLAAVDQTMSSAYAKQLLVDYMMWRKILEGEKFHLGRMVEQECLKGYISTSRNPATAVFFGSAYNKRDTWVYVTLVHGGFRVPKSQAKWGSAEHEIAQWGPIPPDKIVGFRKTGPRGNALSPIYMRRSFRKKEPAAFKAIFNMWSGERPTA